MEGVCLEDLVRAIEGETENRKGLPRTIEGISTDTRTLQPGDAFWAMPGKQADGRQFIEQALRLGAVAVVTERDNPQNEISREIPVVFVQNSVKALQEFAKWYRSRFSANIIGITGSFGKSTTKEALHSILSTRANSLKSEGNFNNEIGVPLTLLNLNTQHLHAVVELGAGKPKDIQVLTGLVSPQIGVISGIGPAHIGNYEGIEQIAETKAELLEGLPKDGLAVIPGDCNWADRLRDRANCRVVSFGHNATNTYRIENADWKNDRLRMRVNGQKYHAKFCGLHFAGVVASVVAVATELDYSQEDIQQGLSAMSPFPGRCHIIKTMPWTVIDDTYNANPVAFRAACQVLGGWSTSGSRILVVGDMLELGKMAEQYHYTLGQEAAVQGIDLVLALGNYSAEVVQGARSTNSNSLQAKACGSHREIINELIYRLKTDDVVLIKGSRGMSMERIIQGLTAFCQRRLGQGVEVYR